MAKSFQEYYDVLKMLAKSHEANLNHATCDSAMRFVLKSVAEALDVERVSFWRYQGNRTAISAEQIYTQSTNEWSKGVWLYAAEDRQYFARLEIERVVEVEDCHNNPLLAGFKENYLKPFNIMSLLDSPIFFDGEMTGIICCETVGVKRSWSVDDKYFVMAAADFLGRILEAEHRHLLEKEAKERLKTENFMRNEAQLRAMLTLLPVPVAMLDKKGRYVAISEMWRRQYNFLVSNPYGVLIWEAHGHFDEQWKKNIEEALKGNVLENHEDYVQVRPHKHIWVSWQLMPWHDLDGEIAGVMVICEDITYRKETEIKLRQTAKLTALGEMASGIAHEINNPLSILKGFIDLMQKNMRNDNLEKGLFSHYLERSGVTLERISRIVNGMKHISRDSSQDPVQSFSVDTLINDSLDLVQEKFKTKGVTLTVEKTDASVKTLCRPGEISQVILNLLTNSLHAVENTSKPEVLIQTSVKAGMVKIAIIDSGTGIADEIAEKIFQPFFTTKDASKGMGLGLSISKRIVEDHKGKIYFDPRQPQTTFIVELPLVTD